MSIRGTPGSKVHNLSKFTGRVPPINLEDFGPAERQIYSKEGRPQGLIKKLNLQKIR